MGRVACLLGWWLPLLAIGGELDLAKFREGKLTLPEPLRENETMLSYECTLAGKKSYDIAFIEIPDPAPKTPLSWLVLFDGNKEVARQPVNFRIYAPGMFPKISCEGSTLKLEANSSSTCLSGNYTWQWDGKALTQKEGRVEDPCSDALKTAEAALKKRDLLGALKALELEMPIRYQPNRYDYELVALAHRLASASSKKGEKAAAGRIAALIIPRLSERIDEITDQNGNRLENEVLVRHGTDLGIYLLESGEAKQAAKLLESILTKSASRAATWLGLADARFALGEIDAAKKAYAGYCKRGGKGVRVARARERAPEECGYH